MQKKTKNMLKKAFKMAVFLAMLAGIIWINALKLQDETLSNYEKITDTGTRDYYNNPVTPVIAALFYVEDIAPSGFKKRGQEKAKETAKMAVVPKEINSFNRSVIDKLYDEISNKDKIKEFLLVFTETKNANDHSSQIKKKFPSAKIKKLRISEKRVLKETDINEYLKDNTKIVVFLANLDRGLNSEKSERLANEAVFFAQKNNYQMNVFDIVDEYIAASLATGNDYIYDLSSRENTDSLAKQKVNLERFAVRYQNEILHYFSRNLYRAFHKENGIELPEKTNKNYRLFDRGAVYVRVYNNNYAQVFEELKLDQNEGLIAVISNITTQIANSSRGASGKYFQIYLLTEMEPIHAENASVLANYLEPDDGVYVSYKKQAGLLLASDRPENMDELIAKARSYAQIRDNVKNSDISFYRFKYAEIQYGN